MYHYFYDYFYFTVPFIILSSTNFSNTVQFRSSFQRHLSTVNLILYLQLFLSRYPTRLSSLKVYLHYRLRFLNKLKKLLLFPYVIMTTGHRSFCY